MLKWLVILTAVVSLRGQGLERGPQPGEGEEPVERKQVRRNPYFYPFANPYYNPFPQVIQVHYVVLQAPHCLPVGQPSNQFPNQPMYPPVQPESPAPPAPTTASPGLDFRIDTDSSQTRPSRCVWAIVACCSPDSSNIRYSCFELLGCPGSFWGVNPCSKKTVQAAANTALMYYMKGEEGSQNNDV